MKVEEDILNIKLPDSTLASLSPEEKKRALYDSQKELLDTFLEHGTISKAQYDKSLGDLTEKMGYGKAED